MYFIVKRILDILISIFALIIMIPFLIIISLIIFITMGSPVFFLQERVGKDWKNFKIYKFRTMVNNADKTGPGVSSSDDKRITKLGSFLRKYKLDELPQFFNVLAGSMSIVGPRPELLKYAKIYKNDYSQILKLTPGITDYASIEFKNEAELLKNHNDSEKFYLYEILPQKISLYKKYLNEISFYTDLKILLYTVKALIK